MPCCVWGAGFVGTPVVEKGGPLVPVKVLEEEEGVEEEEGSGMRVLPGDRFGSRL